MTGRPLCFVVMPFGRKPDGSGRVLDFDAIYSDLIDPVIRAADLEPLRADHDLSGGLIHHAMFEKLMLCDYALADVSLANPNVYYELGVRQGARPHTTVLIAATGTRMPLDLGPVSCVPYELGQDCRPSAASTDGAAIAARLAAARAPVDGSPLYQLVGSWPRPNLARLKTDRFRDVIDYASATKDRIALARRSGGSARNELMRIEDSLPFADVDPALLIDLLLSYRAIGAHQDMVRLIGALPAYLSRTVMVREQLGFALNRLGRRDQAEEVLRKVIAECGPSSETNGLLGRVYKDRWDDAEKAGDPHRARACLRKAIQCYLEGFEADWRDAYPGVNAVTLMEMLDAPDPRQQELLPVVIYAVHRRIGGGQPDYWDYAALLELYVLDRAFHDAEDSLLHALGLVREKWEPASTARNLGLIANVRGRRGEDVEWIRQVVGQLSRVAV